MGKSGGIETFENNSGVFGASIRMIAVLWNTVVELSGTDSSWQENYRSSDGVDKLSTIGPEKFSGPIAGFPWRRFNWGPFAAPYF